MTEYSINGWVASTDERSIGVRSFRIPRTDRHVRLCEDAAPILLWVATKFHAAVANLDKDPLAVWGYKYRPALQGNGALSDHASGTAIDLRSDRFPVGTDNMNRIQKVMVRRILNRCDGLVIWGGDYKSAASKDQMHFAIAPKVTARDIERWRIRRRVDPNGRPLP
jgi:hypothetical protein